MDMDALLYGMEVDVAVRRPPSPANVVTHGVVVTVADRESFSRADNEARLVAAYMCDKKGVMVTAVRIIWVVL